MPASLVVHVEDTPADESEHGRAARRETAEVTRSKASATAIWQMRLPPMLKLLPVLRKMTITEEQSGERRTE